MSTTPYMLPQLTYSYDALEPHISARMLELHHRKHHAGYVENANAVIGKLEEARREDDFTKLGALERALAFHLSGHLLHSIFWKNLSPKGGRAPTGELAEAIERDFSSFDKFRRQLTEVAATTMGSGWAAVVWEPLGKRLLTTQIYDHQSNVNQAGVPLMVIDAWEHAYYLQYQNRKKEFFEAVWHLWDWRDIGERLAAVRKLSIPI